MNAHNFQRSVEKVGNALIKSGEKQCKKYFMKRLDRRKSPG